MTTPDPSCYEPQTCAFVPAHEPWTCRTHKGIRTSLDEPQCDIARPAEPFNLAYIDNLREAGMSGHWPTSRYVVRRLLATIDALRLAADTARPAEPTRDAVAAALFDVYGNVTRQGQSIGPDRPGPRVGYRPLEFWLEDADAVLEYARRYPRG